MSSYILICLLIKERASIYLFNLSIILSDSSCRIYSPASINSFFSDIIANLLISWAKINIFSRWIISTFKFWIWNIVIRINMFDIFHNIFIINQSDPFIFFNWRFIFFYDRCLMFDICKGLIMLLSDRFQIMKM